MVKYNDKNFSKNRKGKAYMSEEKSKKQQLDDFWDISSLVPQKRSFAPSSKSVDTVLITDGEKKRESGEVKITESSTVIERFIPPHTPDELRPQLAPYDEYDPESPLIHKVSLYREPSSYNFYEDFCRTAKRLWNESATECEYVDFFSYSPQYNQLAADQLSYYLWWRENVRRGVYLKTNICYINLYTFELINTRDVIEPIEAREMMIRVLEAYRSVLLGTIPKYIRWISDFSLVHHLPPPKKFDAKLLEKASALKEYFMCVAGNTAEGWAHMLLTYCTSYDYRMSKFATEENIALFEEHVPKAIARVVEKLSENGKILSALPFNDCKISAKAFDGAVCSSENRVIIDVEYCSFSRSHELRFLIGDAVKQAENKIRAHISVKSRLTVYSLPLELCQVINEYFDIALPVVRKSRAKAEAPTEYDVLYDVPRTKLSISNAQKIESESWDTTKELVGEFEESPIEEKTRTIEIESVIKESEEADAPSLLSSLGEYADVVTSLAKGESRTLVEISKSLGRPTEAIVDAINEIAVDAFGDILIEENGGEFSIIEDYLELIN
ncbi:MAG: hypothetical protein E7677_06175 [Ruminococcaceae bacterium]|nr:hypothetical protein [Oscillospiraceae bacterium]